MKLTKNRLLCFFLLAGSSGCGDGKQMVNGTVTFDGQPVTNGTVTFVKTDGENIREGAVIQDGRFQAHVPPGIYTVELHARKVVEKKKQIGFDGTEEEIEITEDLFPERFNTKSELTADIKSGSNALKFDLKSEK